jgi:hypothetical protein
VASFRSITPNVKKELTYYVSLNVKFNANEIYLGWMHLHAI